MFTRGCQRWRHLDLRLKAMDVGLGSARPSLARIPEDRLGVWFTTVDSDVLREPSETDRAACLLVGNGFPRATVPLFTGGSTGPHAP